MKDNTLHTVHLTLGFSEKNNNFIVAKDINIALQKGTLTALVGVNGIGKSTFIKTLTGILEPISGAIFLNNTNLKNYKPIALAKEMSIVLTEKLPPSNLTVYEIVALGRQPYTNWLGTLSQEDKEKVNLALFLCEIESFAHKKHYQLSDGQLQKVMIARALAQETAIIVLDEPTTHLDLEHKASVLKILQKLTKKEKKTIVYSTHDIDLAIQLCDTIMVFSKEGIIHDSPTNLIEKGIFETLFNTENVVFDSKIGKFNII